MDAKITTRLNFHEEPKWEGLNFKNKVHNLELGMGIELPTGESYHHLSAFPAAFLPFLLSEETSY